MESERLTRRLQDSVNEIKQKLPFNLEAAVDETTASNAYLLIRDKKSGWSFAEIIVSTDGGPIELVKGNPKIFDLSTSQ